MTMVEAVILLGFGVPIAAACMAFVVMACRMQKRVFVHSLRIKLGADVESSVLKRL